jgi:hypothetical protein
MTRTGSRGSGAFGREEQRLCAGVGQEECDFPGVLKGVHRHCNRALMQHAVKHHHKLRPVGQHHPDSVTGRYALAN